MIFIALASLPLAVLFAIYSYIQYRRMNNSGEYISIIEFVFKIVLTAFIAYFIGSAIGIGAYCSSNSAGNLCGLPGAIIIGPLFSSIGICIVAWRWLLVGHRE